MKLNPFSNSILLIGAIAPVALAQSAPSNIVSTQENAVPARAAVPAPVASSVAPTKQVMVELKVEDMEVTQLLKLISDQFAVPLVIAGDVTGKLPYINLSNKTPEAAIRAVVNAANLKFRRQEDGTLLIARTLPDEVAPLSEGRILPSPNSNVFGSRALPALTDDDFPTLRTNGEIEIPTLVGNTERSARKRPHTIRVRNVPPKVMAYWLDPANNEVPIQFQVAEGSKDNYKNKAFGQNAVSASDQADQGDGGMASVGAFNGANPAFNPYISQRSNAEIRSNSQFGGGGTGGAGAGAGTGSFQRPAGVERIIAIDPQNALLVFGTDEGVRELQDIINFLDRPLRQVEIEAQFVTVNTDDSSIFGIDYTAFRNNFSFNNSTSAANIQTGSISVGFVGNNFAATLSALLARNRAKVITAPRVTAINNLTASLISSTSSPIVLTTVSQNINGNQGIAQRLIYITTQIGLTVTPTINNDDTVTVLMRPQLDTQTPSGLAGFNSIPLITRQRLETTANVRDGDTIALGGLRSARTTRGESKIPILGDLPVLGALFRSRSAIDNDSELIIFLTARIVRRAGDDDAVPGA